MTPMWKFRQRRAYENMWREAERKRDRERFIAGPLGWIVEVPNWLMGWRVVLALIVLWSLVLAGRAIAQVEVPQPCIDLAASYGRPLPPVLGSLKAERLRGELRSLNNADPAVRRCRDALAKLEAKR